MPSLRTPLTVRRVLTLVAIVVLLVLAWPRGFGGATSYVVVSGISMEPVLESGDLAVVRRADTYGVGDVIAFRTQDGDVIHRVVSGNGVDGYRTQGDNVDKVDPYLPIDEDVRGRLVLHVPKIGAIGLRVVGVIPPWLLIGIAGGLSLMGSPKRRRRRRTVRAGRRPIVSHPSPVGAPVAPDLLQRRRLVYAAVCALVAVAVLPSMVVAFTTPTRLPAAPATAYDVSLRVSGLAAPGSVAYPTGRTAAIESDADGAAVVDPDGGLVARQLSGLEVLVTIVRASDAAPGGLLDGALGLDAAVRTLDGDLLPIPTGAGTRLVDGASLTVELDLDELTAAASSAGGFAGVELTPAVTTTAPVERVFSLDPLVLDLEDRRLVPSGVVATSLTAAPGEQASARVGLLGVSLPTAVVRVVSLLLLVGLGGAAWWFVRQEQEDDPELRIRLLYGSLLVELAPGSNVGGTEVRVASMAELARLAKRDQRSVLHRRDGDGVHRYLVPDGDLTYAFVLDVPRDRGVRAPDDASGLLSEVGDVVRIDDVAVDSFDELSMLWLEPTADGIPGQMERRGLADGRMLYTLLREGQRFTYLADAHETVREFSDDGPTGSA